MRYLVISDIHGNAPALEAVLRDAQAFDALICLGDIVGYGPNPNTCIERVQDFDLTCLCGNHDQGAIGQADVLIFNRDAREALDWTQRELTPENLRFLSGLSPSAELDGEAHIVLAHGSLRDPVWEYIVDPPSATQNFRRFTFQLLMVGHSHLPLIFEWLDDQRRVQLLRPETGVPVHLDGRRLIINSGSVGQPRDGSPHASYGMLDTESSTWTLHRTAYPVEITQERMRANGLPRRLIDRLEVGR
jgi:predicted phosphodiesterase